MRGWQASPSRISTTCNLREHARYRERLLSYTRTRPTAVPLGERRKPRPRGQPGFLRLDTVHLGEQPDAKGVYRINAVNTVDEVTQWEVAASMPRIPKNRCFAPSRIHRV